MLRQPPLQVRGITDVKPIVLRGMQQVDVKHRLYFYREGRVRRSLLRGRLTLPGPSSNKGAPDEISHTSFRRRSGGSSRVVLHSDLRDTRLRRPLLDAGPLRDKASASWRER